MSGDPSDGAAAVSIRDAQATEIGALEQLQRRASMWWEEYRQQLAAHPDAIELSPQAVAERRVRVAVGLGDRQLGFSVVLPIAGGRCELDGLFVDPPVMGRGVGRRLIEDVIAGARGRAGHLDVLANPRALGFYKKLGFHPGAMQATRFGAGQRMHRPL